MTRAVAYLRVSTREQGKSGLGLEAQRATIERRCRAQACDVVEWYTEVESGKRVSDTLAKRPQLAAALNHAAQIKAPVIVAKLDRLSRDVHFISGLMAHNVPFVVCDLPPDAPKLMLHIFASLAEWEREQISDRTKRALAAAKMRGVRLGSPTPLNGARIGGKVSAELRQVAAVARDRTFLMAAGGGSLSERAARLNSAGYRTAHGKEFTRATVSRMLRRAAVMSRKP